MELCFKDKSQGVSRYFGKMSKYRHDCYFGRVIPNFFILDSRVVRFSPSRSAAPFCPLTRQEVLFSTNLGVKSTFDFYKILPKVKRDPYIGMPVGLFLYLNNEDTTFRETVIEQIKAVMGGIRNDKQTLIRQIRFSKDLL